MQESRTITQKVMEMTSIEYTPFEEYWEDYYSVLISMQMYFFMITFPLSSLFHLSIYPSRKRKIQFTLSRVSVNLLLCN